MSGRVPLCLVISVLAAACYDLPDVEPDVCGNKVIDGEEDCDGFTEYGGETACGAPELVEEAKQCVYLCDEGGTACPPGWGCGLNGVCSRPEGTFIDAPASPWHMPVDEFAIGDVDGDGNADLIGNDPAQIMVRFGSSNAEFPDELFTPIRRPTGAVTYTHFDNDTRLDAVVPIDLGLFVLRGGGARTLDSVAYSPPTARRPTAPGAWSTRRSRARVNRSSSTSTWPTTSRAPSTSWSHAPSPRATTG